MTTMTKTTTATPSSSGGSTTSGSSNNRLKQQQHNVEAANLIKEGKFKLKNAILNRNRNEMKEALILLSKQN